MPEWLRYTVLPVGQGTGTFLEVFEGDRLFDDTRGNVVETTLIDLGSLGWKAEAGVPSADFVIAQLRRMPDADRRIDNIFFSHSDSDHTDLLKNVLDAFPDDKLSIGGAWFGGEKEEYKKDNNDPLGMLEDRDVEVAGFEPNETMWDAGRSTHNIQFRLLVANAQSSYPANQSRRTSREGQQGRKRTASDAFLVNTVSLVLAIDYGEPRMFRFIATGDATGTTLATCNKIIKEKRLTISPVYSISLPHHGSKTTTYNVRGIEKGAGETRKTLADRVVEEFVDNVKALSITASAGERFHHPASRVVKDFAKHTGRCAYSDPDLAAQREHFFTAYYPDRALTSHIPAKPKWPVRSNYYTGRTEQNVFTIDYFRPFTPQQGPPPRLNYNPNDPSGFVAVSPLTVHQANPQAPTPRAAGWGFYVSADGGQVALRRLLDLRFVTPADRTAIQTMLGTHPSERFVFVPSAPAPDRGEEPEPPPRPAEVRDAPPPRAPGTSSALRRLRQMP